MSQPKRFRCLTTEEQREFNNKVIMPGLVMCDDGNLVSYHEHIDIVADKDIHIKALRDEVDCVREENAALAAEFGQLKQDYLQLRIKNGNLAAENERLNKNIAVLVDELATVSAKVEWLRKAEHLVIWDGEKWVVRQEQCPGSIANKPFPY